MPPVWNAASGQGNSSVTGMWQGSMEQALPQRKWRKGWRNCWKESMRPLLRIISWPVCIFMQRLKTSIRLRMETGVSSAGSAGDERKREGEAVNFVVFCKICHLRFALWKNEWYSIIGL